VRAQAPKTTSKTVLLINLIGFILLLRLAGRLVGRCEKVS